MPVCSAHIDKALARGWDIANLFVICSEDAIPEAGVRNVGGICVDVQPGPYQESVPSNAFVIYVGSKAEFSSCSDCTDGGKATLCAKDLDEPGAENAPEIWIRKSDLGKVSGFSYGVWCYTAPGSASGPIPDGAIIYRPTQDQDCSTCNVGVKYEVCLDEPVPAVEYWADAPAITQLKGMYPTLTHIYMRIKGVCHALNLYAATSRIPLTAQKITPRCFYLDCWSCICGGALAEECNGEVSNQGLPVKICRGQQEIPITTIWLKESAVPEGPVYFKHEEMCLLADPTVGIAEIPPDALVLDKLPNAYQECSQCLSMGSGEPEDPCEIYPPGDPNRPWWCEGIPESKDYYLLQTCDGEGTPYYLRASHICAIHNIIPCKIVDLVFKLVDGKCYKVVEPGFEDPPGISANNMIAEIMDNCLDPRCTTGICWHRWASTFDCTKFLWSDPVHVETICVGDFVPPPWPTDWNLIQNCAATIWTPAPHNGCNNSLDCLPAPPPPVNLPHQRPLTCCTYRLEPCPECIDCTPKWTQEDLHESIGKRVLFEGNCYTISIDNTTEDPPLTLIEPETFFPDCCQCDCGYLTENTTLNFAFEVKRCNIYSAEGQPCVKENSQFGEDYTYTLDYIEVSAMNLSPHPTQQRQWQGTATFKQLSGFLPEDACIDFDTGEPIPNCSVEETSAHCPDNTYPDTVVTMTQQPIYVLYVCGTGWFYRQNESQSWRGIPAYKLTGVDADCNGWIEELDPPPCLFGNSIGNSYEKFTESVNIVVNGGAPAP